MTETKTVGVTSVPAWTVVIASIFGAVGLAVSALMYFDPAAAPFLSGFEITEDVAPLVAGYAVRNSITALVLLVAVWMRTPSALFAAVSGRLITELMDTARVLATGAEWGLMFILVLIVPAVLVLWKLWPLVKIEMAAARPHSH